MNKSNIKEKYYNALLDAEFLLRAGFSEPARWWDARRDQFRIYYKIDGYDCDILISPVPQVIACESPEDQVEYFSDIKYLSYHHIGDWNVYVNTPDNHVATFYFQRELVSFMALCGCPLKQTKIQVI